VPHQVTSHASTLSNRHKTDVPLGIGYAVANAFAKAGCTRILLVDLNLEGLTAAQETLTKAHPDLRILCLPVDISKDGAMEKALESAMELDAFGRLDYAVNCAGMNGINADHAPTNSTETSLEYFDKLNGINYRGTWMANRAYLKIMMGQEPLPSHDSEVEGREQRGSIVNLSSGLGVIGMPKNRMNPESPICT
jgi:NAD(P)-dependent dehydrogenase (short-subunit alcohol dehydrogenase family)